MKSRDSGMPDQAYWDSFFDAECLVRTMLGEGGCRGNLVEFGSGYGTFTIPAARRTTGVVYAFDIESELVEHVRLGAQREGLENIRAQVRDFVAHGTGLEPQTQAHAMIYNLLHLEDPVALLEEAHRVLAPLARLSVIHWRRDIPTPRGPALEIRPSPDQCAAWMARAGFRRMQQVDLAACGPYHFGLLAER